MLQFIVTKHPIIITIIIVTCVNYAYKQQVIYLRRESADKVVSHGQ